MSIRNRIADLQQKQGDHASKTASDEVSFTGRHYQNLGSRDADPNYGRPISGSRTELRGKQACVHVSGEIVELCSIIHSMGTAQPDGSGVSVEFGPLFETYTRISNKLVGMLIRARKQGLVAFEGEMLFQRRDDNVLITLLKSPDELLAEIEEQKLDLMNHPVK